jgi:hypothetical protein
MVSTSGLVLLDDSGIYEAGGDVPSQSIAASQ